MAVDKLVDSTQLDADLTSVANAIRAKSGGSNQLAFPNGFVSEIGNIPSGGTLITKTFTENGTYAASSDNADGYSSVTVNVAGGMVLLASGDYVLASDITGGMTIPISCNGTVEKIIVVKDSITSGVGQTLAWYRDMSAIQPAIDAFSYITELKMVSSSGALGFQARSNITSTTPTVDSATNPTAIYCQRASNNYFIKADTYHWYIYGEASA